MSRSSALQSIRYETEGTFGENTNTFGTRLPIAARVDVRGIKQASVKPNRVVQRRNEITPNMNGIQSGSFKTKFWLTGHGSTTAGALVLNSLETLLGIVFGFAAAAASSGTTAAAGGTTTSVNTVASGTYTTGGIARFGLPNDLRGNGQFAPFSTHTATVMTLLTALDNALNATDIIWNPAIIYGPEAAATNAVTGTRWLIQTANLTFECHGVYPKSVTFSGLNTGQTPTIEIEWGVSRWSFSATTLPDATAVTTFAAAPVAQGSFVLNTVGQTARTKRNIRDFSLKVNLGIVEIPGPGAFGQYQAVVGCSRIPDAISVEWVEDSEAATTSPVLAGYWDGNAIYKLDYTLSCQDSTALYLGFQYLVPSQDRPTQEDVAGLNRIRIMFDAGTGGTTTSDLSCAAMRIASA